ncbi:class I SAM-dependent methyltransferase [Mycobacterium sp. pUA109]|uniref:class I SAM-dependent methyltransferase n=1 Tax=Mycobacterium sp. pUA109 TaxID=3238982 RepID=UPI00351B87ED
MTTVARRGFNNTITQFWSFAAPAYDFRPLQRWVYSPAHDEVVAQLRRRGPQKVADIACGTGILADRIQREVEPGKVWGVDMSDGMLENARARSSAVVWKKGPAEQLPFDDEELDAVVTTSAFHFFDQPAALREFYRVVAPGGMVAVATMSPRRRLPLHRFTARRLNPAHSPSPSEMRVLFEDAGFTVSDQHRVHRPTWTKVVSDLITVGSKA